MAFPLGVGVPGLGLGLGIGAVGPFGEGGRGRSLMTERLSLLMCNNGSLADGIGTLGGDLTGDFGSSPQ